jgi:hypothetical protein
MLTKLKNPRVDNEDDDQLRDWFFLEDWTSGRGVVSRAGHVIEALNGSGT